MRRHYSINMHSDFKVNMSQTHMQTLIGNSKKSESKPQFIIIRVGRVKYSPSWIRRAIEVEARFTRILSTMSKASDIFYMSNHRIWETGRNSSSFTNAFKKLRNMFSSAKIICLPHTAWECNPRPWWTFSHKNSKQIKRGY